MNLPVVNVAQIEGKEKEKFLHNKSTSSFASAWITMI